MSSHCQIPDRVLSTRLYTFFFTFLFYETPALICSGYEEYPSKAHRAHLTHESHQDFPRCALKGIQGIPNYGAMTSSAWSAPLCLEGILEVSWSSLKVCAACMVGSDPMKYK